MTELRSEVAQDLSLDRLRYSQVWEDHRLLEAGLAIKESDDVLSITSAGDNALALLLQGPRSVTAIDMNPSQNALLELKLRAIEALEPEDFAVLLGLREQGSGRAWPLYQALRNSLSKNASHILDQQERSFELGINESGRLESYIIGFARNHLEDLWPSDLLDRLIDSDTLEGQAELFREEGLTDGFKERFRWYFGREMMAKNGRDPSQFRHVEGGDVGLYFLQRITWACTETKLSDNYYVEYFLSGQYRDLDKGPPYVQPKNYEKLRSSTQKVRIITGELEQLDRSSFSKANLSDIFEYMSPELNEAVFSLLADRIRPGGRIAWWNLLVPREVPASLHDRLSPLPKLSRRLWHQDRSWFYRAFHVAEAPT